MLYPNTPLTGLEIWVLQPLTGLVAVSHPPAKGGRVGRGESAYRVGLSSDTSAPPSWGAGPQQESSGRYDSSTLVGGRRRRRPPPFDYPLHSHLFPLLLKPRVPSMKINEINMPLWQRRESRNERQYLPLQEAMKINEDQAALGGGNRE